MAVSSPAAANDSRQIFRIDPCAYTVRDVIDAAFFRADLQPVWEELLRLCAAESRATEEDRDPDEEAVDAAAQAFRYDHDLITAEETERWLADRGLSLEDFGDYFERHYWGELTSEPAELEPTDYLEAPPELHDLLYAELMLSGALSRMADSLAWRLAAAAELATPVSAEQIEAQRDAFLQRLDLRANGPTEWLTRLGRTEAWLEEMLRLETICCEQRARLLTPEARRRELSALRLQLTVFDVEIIEFDSRDAACEALFCVRADGMEMEEVAAEGRYPFHREKLLLEDIPDEMQQQFLSVVPGHVLEPIEREGAHRLCRVMGKSEPNPDDPAVRQRIENRLLDFHFSEVVGKHVHWDLALS